MDRHLSSNSIDHRRDRLSTESNNTIPAHWRGKDSPGGPPRRYSNKLYYYTLSHPENDHDVTEHAKLYTLQDASFMR